MPSSQRPFFLSSIFAAFRQQPPSLSASTQSNKHTHPHATSQSTPSAQARSISSTSPSHPQGSSQTATSSPPPRTGGGGSVMSQLQPLQSPRSIPGAAGGGRLAHRRGSDSSSEGFRDVRGADKWYIGGRTAAGEEKFFKLGVVKRVRSQDRLSLDRLSL
ncbi:hypothetical protein F4777DRAFT_292507 [Nemania sp. FL0916]|nr:hypothetical protein F4777DRAFT_292507 [Nemania sp. FL0916]